MQQCCNMSLPLPGFHKQASPTKTQNMKMNRVIPRIFPIILAAALLTACEDDAPDDPHIPHEAEMITTLTYTLIPVNEGDTVVFSFRDLDGDGGMPPTISGGTMQKNATYRGELELLNELENPPENITEEIEEEAPDHQVFFQSSLDGLMIAYDDADEQGNPIGLATIVTTGEAESGSLTIVLRHEPDKSAPGVAEGDSTHAGGETDIEVTFQVDVQ